MTIHIPKTIFDGISKWLDSSGWIDNFEEVLDEYFGQYLEDLGLQSLDEFASIIDPVWYLIAENMAFNDLISRDFGEGTAVETYLKKQGWKEKPLVKAYLKALLKSKVCVYEVTNIKVDESFDAIDVMMGQDTKTVQAKEVTHHLEEGGYYITRLMDVRGHTVSAGGFLPTTAEVAKIICADLNDAAAHATKVVLEEFGDDPQSIDRLMAQFPEEAKQSP